jgi:AraC-like DNA-binding protein
LSRWRIFSTGGLDPRRCNQGPVSPWRKASTHAGALATLNPLVPRKADPTEFFLPGSYACLILAVAERWGVTSAELFTPLGVDQQDLEAPESRIPVSTACAVIRRARLLTGEPALGIHIGLQMHPITLGYLGFASMSAASLGQCIDFAIRFAPALTNVVSFRLHRSGEIAGLVVDEHCPLIFGDVRDVALLGLLVGMRTVGCSLTGREPWRPIDVAMPEPDYYDRIAHLVPELRFGQPINQIVHSETDLELPLRAPDRAAMRLAVGQCEQAMEALGLSAGIEARALQLILQRDGPPSFNKVASSLHLSPRTLRRRLAESGVRFSELVEKARGERALLLLRSPEVSLDEIADRLGYSTVSNFARAFRRWTGLTPAAYRRSVKGRLSAHDKGLAVRPSEPARRRQTYPR